MEYLEYECIAGRNFLVCRSIEFTGSLSRQLIDPAIDSAEKKLIKEPSYGYSQAR